MKFAGFDIIPTPHLEDVAEDWTKVRSPGRAKRRRKKHRQQIKIVRTPRTDFYIDEAHGAAYCHPAMVAKLRERIGYEQALDKTLDTPIPQRKTMEDLIRDEIIHAPEALWLAPMDEVAVRVFSRFPDEFGGAEEHANIMRSARQYGGRLQWRLPDVNPEAWMEPNWDVPANPQASYTIIVFNLERIYVHGHPTYCLAFNNRKDADLFDDRLKARRRFEREDRARYDYPMRTSAVPRANRWITGGLYAVRPHHGFSMLVGA